MLGDNRGGEKSEVSFVHFGEEIVERKRKKKKGKEKKEKGKWKEKKRKGGGVCYEGEMEVAAEEEEGGC